MPSFPLLTTSPLAAYPTPFFGSYEALGLDTTWITTAGRYGPYGYGEDKDETYNRTKVDWNKVDWGKLQNECFDRNARRFPDVAKPLDNMLRMTRFRLRDAAPFPEVRHWHEFEPTRRTAIVLRAWRGYAYKDEDMHHIRSLVVETGLRTGGEYHVIILVDMKDYEHPIFDGTEESYHRALKDAGVPPEFQSMAVLWDDRLLESWYPLVEEHK